MVIAWAQNGKYRAVNLDESCDICVHASVDRLLLRETEIQAVTFCYSL